MRKLISLFALSLLCSCGPSKNAANQSARALAGKTVSFSWAASSGTVTGYVVEQSTDNTTFTTAVTTTGLSASIGGLVSGRTYYFRVKGFNGGGYSTASNLITIPL